MSDDPSISAAWLDGEHVARRRFAGIQPWPGRPDQAFAYAVQDGLLARRLARTPSPVAGYKIGLTTPRMQRLCRGDRPISGVMFASGLRHAPARIALDDFVHLGIESELAVRVSHRLTGGPAPITRAEVAASIDAVAAAFELIEDRNADYTTLDWLWMAADNSWHGGLVLGPAAPLCDLSDLEGVLAIDGVEVDRGSTRDVLGHPLDAVAWLANHLGARGMHIEPGHWISTGSIATIRFAEHGRSYRFTVAGLPPVAITVA